MPPLSVERVVEQVPVTKSTQHAGAGGAVFGSIVILVIMAFGAFYLWGAWLNQQDTRNSQQPQLPVTVQQ